MVGVAAGEVSTIFAGNIYCSMIEGCQEIADFDRAARWTAALTTWCAEQPGLVPFTGQCAVHRGQIMRAQGAFDEALNEFDLAVRRYLADQTPGPAGLAMAERGDVLRLRGDLAGAQAAYDQAVTFGHEPQPGLALLWLAQGRTEAAVAAIRRLLGETARPGAPFPTAAGRGRGPAGRRPARRGRRPRRRAASPSPRRSAARRCRRAPTTPPRWSRSRPAIRRRRLPLLRRARAVWERLGARYETARCRVLLGRALRALGDDESAVAELAAARRSFAELGAGTGRARGRRADPPHLPGGLTAREVEVLRLVAAGKTNPEIATLLFLSEKTVARHLSNIFTKLDVTTRTAAAAFAFEHHMHVTACRHPDADRIGRRDRTSQPSAQCGQTGGALTNSCGLRG